MPPLPIPRIRLPIASPADAPRVCGASNSLIFCGRVKTLVAASSPKEAIEAGKKAISASIEDNMEATGYGCMDLDSIAKLGDTEIYANMHTV